MDNNDNNDLAKALAAAAEEFFADEVNDLVEERDKLKKMITDLNNNLSLLKGLVVTEVEETEEAPESDSEELSDPE